MADSFHFLHAEWLWALLPLTALLWQLWRRSDGDNPWRQIVAPNLQALLLGGADRDGGRQRRHWLTLLAMGWLLTVLALADPVWDRAPSPVYQSQTARVIVLDLSRSMLTRDLSPDRLTRARYKVEDIVRLAAEGQVGLVVFAGDAFTVTPLTRDAETLRSQLHALEPGIMPLQGSRADLGLRQAGELLQQAGLTEGQVLLIADGVEGQSTAAAAGRLKKAGYRVAVLGVGTLAGAPLSDHSGRTLHDAGGKVIVPALEQEALRAVAVAGGGPYVPIAHDDKDVRTLLAAAATGRRIEQSGDGAAAPRWQERGPWLVLLLLPLAVLVFRRGWLFSVALLAVCIAPAPPSVAATGTAAQAWQNLWQTPEQQAAKALSDGDFARASALANDPMRRGSAHYKRGDYAAALADFGQAQGAEASYNRGNALAKLGRYQDALSAYDEALQAHPGMDDAAANKAAVEALLAQQRQAQQQQEQQNAQQERNQQSNQGSEQPPQQQGGSGKQTQPDQQGAPEQHDQAGAGGERSAQQSAAGADEGGEKPDQAAATQGDDAARQASSGERNAARELPGESQTADNGKAAHGVSPQAENDGSTGAQTQAEEQRPPDIQQERSDDQDRNAFADALEELTRRGDREEASGTAAAQTSQADTQPSAGGSGAAEALNSEERLAAEQWLRRIPDDPGGLLRRKFQYQYQQRHGGVDSGSRQGW